MNETTKKTLSSKMRRVLVAALSSERNNNTAYRPRGLRGFARTCAALEERGLVSRLFAGYPYPTIDGVRLTIAGREMAESFARNDPLRQSLTETCPE